MDHSQCRVLQLPLELRHQIYQTCFDSAPQPSLLRVNKSFYYECIDFLRKRQQTFTYNITANQASFDEFSQWCFKVKGHVPRLGRMKHIILNVYPPDPDKPHEMWHIWQHVQSFCKDLTLHRRIPQLTVEFVDSKRSKWMTDGIANANLNLPFFAAIDDFGQYDIDQILMTIYRFLNNVDKPRIVVPHAYVDTTYRYGAKAQEWINSTERLMTGQWTDEDADNDYSILEDQMKVELWYARQATGRKSKAMFEEMFGYDSNLEPDEYAEFARDWPCMEYLEDSERPLCVMILFPPFDIWMAPSRA